MFGAKVRLVFGICKKNIFTALKKTKIAVE
jgi:hypothetical protein